MNVEVFQLSKPAPRNPFMSETFDVVRLSDYKCLLRDIEELKQVCATRERETSIKLKRYSRNPRFVAAFNWWRGCNTVWSTMESQFDRIIENTRKRSGAV